MSDFASQRKNMVESQLRPSDISDRRILRVMGEIPRELFVPPELRSLAYMDGAVALDTPRQGQPLRAMMAPRTFAKLLDLAEIAPGDAVLDVGCGTGYSTAVLAKLARQVTGMEADPELAKQGASVIAALAVENAAIYAAPLPQGYPDRAPYDVIVLEGLVSRVPPNFFDQLADGGRLAAITPSGGVARAALWRRAGPVLGMSVAFDAFAPPLPGFEKHIEFVL